MHVDDYSYPLLSKKCSIVLVVQYHLFLTPPLLLLLLLLLLLITHTHSSLGKIAAIAGFRTFLAFMLSGEIEEVRKEIEHSNQKKHRSLSL